MRLTDGLAWSLPVTLAASEDTARTLREGFEVALVDGDGEPVATMLLRERYRYDKEREAGIGKLFCPLFLRFLSRLQNSIRERF